MIPLRPAPPDASARNRVTSLEPGINRAALARICSTSCQSLWLAVPVQVAKDQEPRRGRPGAGLLINQPTIRGESLVDPVHGDQRLSEPQLAPTPLGVERDRSPVSCVAAIDVAELLIAPAEQQIGLIGQSGRLSDEKRIDRLELVRCVDPSRLADADPRRRYLTSSGRTF